MRGQRPKGSYVQRHWDPGLKQLYLVVITNGSLTLYTNQADIIDLQSILLVWRSTSQPSTTFQLENVLFFCSQKQKIQLLNSVRVLSILNRKPVCYDLKVFTARFCTLHCPVNGTIFNIFFLCFWDYNTPVCLYFCNCCTNFLWLFMRKS